MVAGQPSAPQPAYLSTRAGEAVLVTCRWGDLARVVGFFEGGDDVVAGWARANRVRMRGDGRVRERGALDRSIAAGGRYYVLIRIGARARGR